MISEKNPAMQDSFHAFLEFSMSSMYNKNCCSCLEAFVYEGLGQRRSVIPLQVYIGSKKQV